MLIAGHNRISIRANSTVNKFIVIWISFDSMKSEGGGAGNDMRRKGDKSQKFF